MPHSLLWGSSHRNKNLDKEQEKDLNELMEQNKNLYESYLLKE